MSDQSFQNRRQIGFPLSVVSLRRAVPIGSRITVLMTPFARLKTPLAGGRAHLLPETLIPPGQTSHSLQLLLDQNPPLRPRRILFLTKVILRLLPQGGGIPWILRPLRSSTTEHLSKETGGLSSTVSDHLPQSTAPSLLKHKCRLQVMKTAFTLRVCWSPNPSNTRGTLVHLASLAQGSAVSQRMARITMRR